MTQPLEEKRRFTRIFFDAATHLVINNQSLQCDLIDLSLNGCLVIPNKNDVPVEINQTVTVEIKMSDELRLHALGHVVFIGDEQKTGVQFDDIDIDSITLLRRFVELNMGDTIMLDRSLEALSNLNT